MESTVFDGIAAFLVDLEKLKQVTRTAYVSDLSRHENSAEHSWHLAMGLLTLARELDLQIDVSRAVLMALAHDVCEIDAGDVSVYDPEHSWKAEHERACLDRLAGQGLKWGAEIRELWLEYETQATAESRWVKVMDRVMPFLVNLATEGRAWRDRGISRSQVLAVNEVVRQQAPDLFAWMQPQIEACVEKGWLRDA
jgi:putative hydrolase of HD superfamily